VPDAERALRERHPLLAQAAVRAVDEAYLYGVGAGRGHGEADPAAVGMGTQWEDRHDRRG
jgi:hypothetical protein